MGPNILKCWLENESKLIIILISQNIIADLKGPKENIICTMADVRGDLLGPPHGTTPAAVIGNKNKTSSKHINEKGEWVIPRLRLVVLKPLQ